MSKENNLPYFIKEMNDDYTAKVSHTFVLHGNIYDNVDNQGADLPLNSVLATFYDDNLNGSEVMKNFKRIAIFYNIAQGVMFPSPKSLELWKAAHIQVYGKKVVEEDWPANWANPIAVPSFIGFLFRWKHVAEVLAQNNMISLKNKNPVNMELRPTIIITDADAFVPRGAVATLNSDRDPIVALRNLSKDADFGNRARIILITRQLGDINESIRSELSTSYAIRKPSFDDRLTWLKTFNEAFKQESATLGVKKNKAGQEIKEVMYATDFSAHQFAVQAAGMNIQQMKDVIMQSWLHNIPIDYSSVMVRKQRALTDEYEGMLDFEEPEIGFEIVGGHEHFKKYAQRKIIQPLQVGDKKRCSRGVLLTGPPGTGKSLIASALAKEAKMNFLKVDLGKCFGSLVGESEANMRKLIDGIEASAPCIVFIDEIDSVLSSGRSSQGDSGTSARIFNSFMTWMSDPSRSGRIVVIAASNRPDLLDAALIRSGRFDAKLPILPPMRGDGIGRKQIIAGLLRKLGVKLNKELRDTEQDKKQGMGKLLWDEEHIWTGAEIEVVLKEALDNAAFAERKNAEGVQDFAIRLTDFNEALESIIPNTAEVERMSKLAIYYTDNLSYTPECYRALAKNKAALRDELFKY